MRFARVAFGLLLLSAAAAVPAQAQQYVISTYAGGAPPPTPGPAVEVAIGSASGVAKDAAGNVYFASDGLHVVFKLDPSGVLTRVAGNSRRGYSGDGGPAASAQLNFPTGVAVDGAGNVFIADIFNHRIRRVSPSGIITTVAGGGTLWGSSGDGGPATDAQLSAPAGVAVDGAGNLFIADYNNHRIRKVSPNGIITTVAGNGTRGRSGDGGPASSAELSFPDGVVVDSAGNLFIADFGNSRVRKVAPDGIITTVAGNGMPSFSGDGGPAASAQLSAWAVAVDGAGNLFISDGSNHRIRKVSPSGIITTVAGNGTQGFSGDGGPAASAQLWGPEGVAVDGAGNLFIAERVNHRIRRVSPSGIITTVAGNGTFSPSFSGDGGPATSANLAFPRGVAVDGAGNLFIADQGNNRVRKVSPSGIITTVAGNGTRGFSGDGGPAATAQLGFLWGVAVDGAGNLFIAEGNFRVRKVSPGGIITTVAGTGTQGFSGDGGPATSAQLSAPIGVAVDGAGNLFIADTGNHRIRKVSQDGVITTVAGNGTMGFSGDGGPAASAQLWFPTGMAVDGAGNLFIVDYGSNRIRKVSPSGIITTVAGNGTEGLGDGGPATSAQLYYLAGVAVDGAGNLFIATSDFEEGGLSSERIRKVSSNGIITTVAGTGTYGYSGDGGPATSAQLSLPLGVAVDAAGNVYVADTGNNVVRILRPTDRSVFLGAVVDAASQRVDPVSPGKIVVLYGAGLGPAELIQNQPGIQPGGGVFGTELAGTTVSFNGIVAPLLYTSARQVAAIVPYAISGTASQVTVAYQGQVSAAFTVPVAPSAPGLFTLNLTGAGQAAAINAVDGTLNTAANPVKIGGYISLYATGEGQTAPAGVDGRLAGATPPQPVLPVRVTVGGIPAPVQYRGGAPGQVAGLMQVNVQIPNGVQPGGYVPVVLQVGERSSSPAVWIAIAAN